MTLLADAMYLLEKADLLVIRANDSNGTPCLFCEDENTHALSERCEWVRWCREYAAIKKRFKQENSDAK